MSKIDMIVVAIVLSILCSAVAKSSEVDIRRVSPESEAKIVEIVNIFDDCEKNLGLYKEWSEYYPRLKYCFANSNDFLKLASILAMSRAVKYSDRNKKHNVTVQIVSFWKSLAVAYMDMKNITDDDKRNNLFKIMGDYSEKYRLIWIIDYILIDSDGEMDGRRMVSSEDGELFFDDPKRKLTGRIVEERSEHPTPFNPEIKQNSK